MCARAWNKSLISAIIGEWHLSRATGDTDAGCVSASVRGTNVKRIRMKAGKDSKLNQREQQHSHTQKRSMD